MLIPHEDQKKKPKEIICSIPIKETKPAYTSKFVSALFVDINSFF